MDDPQPIRQKPSGLLLFKRLHLATGEVLSNSHECLLDLEFGVLRKRGFKFWWHMPQPMLRELPCGGNPISTSARGLKPRARTCAA
ncbi:hypothetical protein [Deinococcus marmoris]|uniref:hypothetical protein n=1 Tax=Deinococcus marmoris TaxID=249408 RepID=UPI00111515D4|nr:hypothetical protein [Deinococcus marmoris]